MIFASAPSQNEFLASLAEAPDIDWSRVTAFHLDEYLGMDDQAPQSFRQFLIDRLVNKVPLGEFHGLRGDAPDGRGGSKRYAELLRRIPLTLPCSESAKMVIWRLSIHRSATSTIPKQSRWSNSMRSVETSR